MENKYIFEDITDKEFKLFKEVIYNECGINLTEIKKTLLQSRLLRRIRKLDVDSYREYYEYLINNYDVEIENLINVITTNKTDFFREDKHFKFLMDNALPEFERAGKKKLRIWSAGCSTGEEPYTIAMTISEYYKNEQKADIKILATDIDTQVLKNATSGIYTKESLTEVDPIIIKKYFLRGKGENNGLFKVKNSVKKMIYFRRLNLLDNTYPMKNQFDLIFCRNVIIYFDSDTRIRLFEQFHKYLKEDGYFFAGHSESLHNISNKFELINSTVYRKVA